MISRLLGAEGIGEERWWEWKSLPGPLPGWGEGTVAAPGW